MTTLADRAPCAALADPFVLLTLATVREPFAVLDEDLAGIERGPRRCGELVEPGVIARIDPVVVDDERAVVRVVNPRGRVPVLKDGEYVVFESLFTPHEGRMGVVVSFMAILELLKEALIAVVQNEPFAPIYVKAAA